MADITVKELKFPISVDECRIQVALGLFAHSVYKLNIYTYQSRTSGILNSIQGSPRKIDCYIVHAYGPIYGIEATVRAFACDVLMKSQLSTYQTIWIPNGDLDTIGEDVKIKQTFYIATKLGDHGFYKVYIQGGSYKVYTQ